MAHDQNETAAIPLTPANSRSRWNDLPAYVVVAITLYGVLWWIFSGNQFGRINDLPLLFVPSILGLGIGIIAVPIISLLLLVRISIIFLKTPPRPYTISVFLAVVVIPPTAAILGLTENSGAEIRWLVAATAIALLTLGETWLRGLPKPHFESSAWAIVICLGAYYFFVCAIVSASI